MQESEQQDEPDEFDPVPPKDPAMRCVMELWPHATPKDWIKSLIAGMMGSQIPACLVALTTSAHPSPALLGHDLHIPVHIFLDRVQAHGRAHGESLLGSTILQELMCEERAKVGNASKRLNEYDLHFVKLQAPTTQTTLFQEAAEDISTPSWRRGFDQYPNPDVLEQAVHQLIRYELETFPWVPVVHSGVTRGLAAKGHLKDGEMIADPVPVLTFSSPAGVLEFLNQGGNAALVEGPLLKITGIEQGDPTAQPMVVYAVLLGVGRFIRDFREVGENHEKISKFRKPNAAWRVRPGRGPNDGFLSLEVCTHNGCGIRDSSEITVDMGADFVECRSPDMPAAKKFKGALEHFWSRTVSQQAAGASTQQGTSGETANKIEEEKKRKADPDLDGDASKRPRAGDEQPRAGDEQVQCCWAGKGDFSVNLLKDGSVVLRVQSPNKAASLSAKTAVLTLDKGTVDDPPTPSANHQGFQWSFGKLSTHVLFEIQGELKEMSLLDLIKHSQATQVYNHDKFPPGTPPGTLTPKSTKVFCPSADAQAVEALIKATQTSKKAGLLWQVKVDGAKKGLPLALVLWTKRALSVKADVDNVL